MRKGWFQDKHDNKALSGAQKAEYRLRGAFVRLWGGGITCSLFLAQYKFRRQQKVVR